MVKAGDPRLKYEWQRIRAQLRALELPCHLCGGAIDYDAKAGTRDSFTVDHLIPVSVNPDAAFDLSNLAAAHHACNSGRRDRPPSSVAPRRQTRRW